MTHKMPKTIWVHNPTLDYCYDATDGMPRIEQDEEAHYTNTEWLKEQLGGMRNDPHNIMIAEALQEHATAKALTAHNAAIDKILEMIDGS